MHLIIRYLAVYFGIFVEGETVMIASSFAAHRGYMDIFTVVFTGFIGTQTSDWFYFFVGRKRGKLFLNKRPRLKNRSNKINRWLHRYPVLVMLAYRFLYGFRMITPLILGMSRIKTRRFALYSVLTTVIWAIVFGTAGYYFGALFESRMKRLEKYELIAVIGIFMIGFIVFLIRRLSKKSEIEIPDVSS
jgi:membrane protein DedA with SNARE-associated domain